MYRLQAAQNIHLHLQSLQWALKLQVSPRTATEACEAPVNIGSKIHLWIMFAK